MNVGAIRKPRSDNNRRVPEVSQACHRISTKRKRRNKDPNSALDFDNFWRRDSNVTTSASMCTGMDIGSVSLEIMFGDRRKVQNVFAFDILPEVRDFLKYNFPDLGDTNVGSDVNDFDVTSLPTVDMFWAGFPCQPFSSQGLQQGLADEKGRGMVIFQIIKYLLAHPPNKSFILENTPGLVTKFEESFELIIATLKKVEGFKVHWRIMDSRTLGFAQSRPRIYIVGVRDGADFKWPGPL